MTILHSDPPEWQQIFSEIRNRSAVCTGCRADAGDPSVNIWITPTGRRESVSRNSIARLRLLAAPSRRSRAGNSCRVHRGSQTASVALALYDGSESESGRHAAASLIALANAPAAHLSVEAKSPSVPTPNCAAPSWWRAAKYGSSVSAARRAGSWNTSGWSCAMRAPWRMPSQEKSGSNWVGTPGPRAGLLV